GLTIATDPPPHIGALLIEVLNILEGYDLRARGQGSAAYLDVMARALYLTFRDRASFMADPRFVEVPVERLLSKAHAAELRAELGRAGGRAAERSEHSPPGPGTAGTTQVTTYDEAGSAVSFTHSVGIGSGVVTPGLGFMYNNGMHAFDRRPGRP